MRASAARHRGSWLSTLVTAIPTSRSATSPSTTRWPRRRSRCSHDARPARAAHGAPPASSTLQVARAPRGPPPGRLLARALLRRLPRRHPRRRGGLQTREERRDAHQSRPLPVREEARRLRLLLSALARQEEIQTLATCHFIEHGENVLVFGPPGVGKTHLAVGLGLKAIEHGYRVLFTTAAGMIAKLTPALAEGKLEEKLKLFT